MKGMKIGKRQRSVCFLSVKLERTMWNEGCQTPLYIDFDTVSLDMNLNGVRIRTFIEMTDKWKRF